MNSSTPTVPSRRVPPLAASITVIIMATTCFLLGVLGNAHVLIQLYKRKNLRRVPHYLFANLSAAGVLATSIGMSTIVVGLILNYLLDRQESMVVDFIWAIGTATAFAASILNAATLSLMAVDRQDCVLRPLQRRLTPYNVKKIILSTWIITAALTIPFVVLRSLETPPYSSQTDPYVSFTNNTKMLWMLYTVGLITIQSVVTFLVITITFFRVIKKLRSSVMPLENVAQQMQQRREYRITKLTYQTCGVYLVSWLPLILMVTVVARATRLDPDIARAIRMIMIVFANFNYAVNPFLNIRLLQHRTQNHVMSMVPGSCETPA